MYHEFQKQSALIIPCFEIRGFDYVHGRKTTKKCENYLMLILD